MTPEQLEKRREYQRRYAANPEVRAKMRARQLALYYRKAEDPNFLSQRARYARERRLRRKLTPTKKQ